ncbi:MAG TPA: hypothetical protein VGD01_01115 [Candidatus Elarobacter sp.]
MSTPPFPIMTGAQYPVTSSTAQLGVAGWGEFLVGPNDLVAIGVDGSGATKWKMTMHVDQNASTIALGGFGGYAGLVNSAGRVTPSHAPSALDKQMAQAMINDINAYNSGGGTRPGHQPQPASVARHTLGTRNGCIAETATVALELLVGPETGFVSDILAAHDIYSLVNECNIGTPYAGQDLPSSGGGGGSGSPSTPADCYVDGIHVPCTNLN